MQRKTYRWFRVYGYPGFGLILYLILVLLSPYDRTLRSWQLYRPQDFAIEFLFSVTYAAFLFETGIQLTSKLNKWIPWESQPPKRFVVQLGLHVLILYVLLDIFFKFRFPAYFGYDELMMRQTFIIGIIFTLLITAIFTAEHYFYRWNDANLKSVELEQLTTRAQLEALKLQLDPHFLFNNFSVVTALIEDQPDAAIFYVSKLSSIYRYMLKNRELNLIGLKEEIAFIRSYLYLYQVRYEDGIRVNIDVSDEIAGLLIPPMTLQLLIENAVKHNQFSSDAPLCIHISLSDNNTLNVENNVMPKFQKAQGMRTGLKNIAERYRLLNDRAPSIIQSEKRFKVELPLIG